MNRPMMKKPNHFYIYTSFAAALLIASMLSTINLANAKTLRWSNQGDATTHDPHADNESFNKDRKSVV